MKILKPLSLVIVLLASLNIYATEWSCTGVETKEIQLGKHHIQQVQFNALSHLNSDQKHQFEYLSNLGFVNSEVTQQELPLPGDLLIFADVLQVISEKSLSLYAGASAGERDAYIFFGTCTKN